MDSGLIKEANEKLTNEEICEYLEYAPAFGFLCRIHFEYRLKVDIVMIYRDENGEMFVYSEQYFLCGGDDAVFYPLKRNHAYYVDYSNIQDFSQNGIINHLLSFSFLGEARERHIDVHYDIFTFNNILRSLGEPEKNIKESLLRIFSSLFPVEMNFDENEKKFLRLMHKAEAELSGRTIQDVEDERDFGIEHMYGTLNYIVSNIGLEKELPDQAFLLKFTHEQIDRF